MTLILHNYWRSSASYRVRIALGLKGLAYDYQVVNIVADGGQQHRPEYKARNPMAQVPTLEVRDPDAAPLYLAQSLPIIEYLDERWPEPPLLPRGAGPAAMALRARVRALAELVNAGIQPLQNLSTTNRVKAMGGDDRAWVQGFIASGLAAYQDAVAGGDRFSVGDAPTLADCCLIPQLYSARRFGVSLDGLPRLRAIEDACADHPAFAAAHPDRQPDAVA
ncbi:MAG: maleylacetoacetate isomerase [Kofleriaceae bacterium]|nr:maleylacetoacetate isomerase [Kofleriaceae bacterium]MBP9170823.1 maleylacetoacetate isomerase [Kofleriaceae bacterium]MBP9857662.1 maleylacetoacetate isomerase [Kofleriaceae bacterium]